MSVPSFIIPPSDPTGADPNFALKQALAKRALERSGDYSPIQSPWQGLARMGDALVGALAMRSAAEDTTNANKSLMDALGMAQGGQNAQSSSQTGGALGQFLTGQNSPVPAPGAVQDGGAVSAPGANPQVLSYLEQAAKARGIDPAVAVKAFGHEGLNVFDPSKPDAGGDGGSSFGPTQLHYGGVNPAMPGAGLGDEFTKQTGLNARDPSTWQKQIDFSLDQVRKGGWGPWMGAKAEGITGMMGVGDLPQSQVASAAQTAYAPAAVMPGSAAAAIDQQMAKNPDWLQYDNEKAIRNQPLSPQLTQALSFLPELGVTAKVFSGGQDAEGDNRTGSHRHDGGGAGDMLFYKDGRQLDWNNPADVPIFQQIVERGKANGLTGFGAGPGYMQPGSMHVGFGNPAVWGAGGSSDNAPDWLRQAYNAQNSAPSAASAFTAQPQASSAAAAIAAQTSQKAPPYQVQGDVAEGIRAHFPTAAAFTPEALDHAMKATAAFQPPAQMDTNYFPPAPAAPPQSPTLGGQLAAYGGGGMQNGMNPKLLAALLNPALPDSARQLGMGMLQMQMQPKNDFLTRPDGSVVMVNKFTGQAQVVQPAQRNPVFQQVDDPVTGLKRTIAVDPITARPIGELTPNGMVQPGQQPTQAEPGSNGIDIFTGKPNAPVGQVPLAGAPLTNDVKDYRAYAMDQQSRGEPVKSFNEWSMDQKKAGAQSVTIAGETEESKALGAARAKNIVDYMEAGKSARDKLQALQIMEGALAAPGGTDFTTGPGAEMALKAKQALSSLTGQPLDGVANAEIIKKTGAYLASAAAKDLANRPTQFDFKTFLENNPGLDISMQGNRLLINLMKQQAQHQMDLARLAQSYKGNTADWNDVVAEYDKSHPILNPMTGKPLAPNENLGFPDASNGPKAGDVEGGYRFKGGSPGDPSNWEKVQ